MRQQILLSAQELHAAQRDETVLVVDCRFVLSDPAKGYSDYLHAHIPGAVYAHLDDDLSNPVTGISGRHPLPDADRFAGFLARSGWQAGTRLVAYDDAGGSIAARLWWLMKYFGHDDAVLLDGGLPAWQSAGYELESGQVTAANAVTVSLKARSEMAVSTPEILESLARQVMVLADVRAAERFKGEIEPIDSVAGHIPGALNYPFQLCLAPHGRFKPVSDVRKGLLTLQGSNRANDLVFMCGSGVTACHTIFAAELAGIKDSRLYAGSWSEWIRDSSRPVETGTT
ncbi:MAG: sulfurtransferase [Xanthomonadales bacterium]|nr:sulfurtransferase [Xanthomonadales bacterium]